MTILLKLKVLSRFTLSARGFSSAVSGVGHVFAARAVGIRPLKRSKEFPSAAREKKPLVPRVVEVGLLRTFNKALSPLRVWSASKWPERDLTRMTRTDLSQSNMISRYKDKLREKRN